VKERELSLANIKLQVGVPANPVSEIMIDVMRQVLAQTPGILEAYLPLCIIEGDQEARQVLLVGLDPLAKTSEVMEELGWKMKLVLPANEFIDIMPAPPSSPLLVLAATTEPDSLIFKKKRRRWWKIW
jgi:hypothetical protein